MAIDVTAEVQVARPHDAVAAYMTDPANDPEWIGGIREARLLGDPPIKVGSQVAREARFLGRKIDYVNEVTELDSEHLDMRSVVAPFPMRITYEFEERDGGTRVSNHVRGGGSRLMAPIVRRSIRRDLERLREILERTPT